MIIGYLITEENTFGNKQNAFNNETFIHLKMRIKKIMMILEIITEQIQIGSHVKYTIMAESIRL